MKVQQIVNKVYERMFTLIKRYVILMGGRGAGRSTVESQYILSKLLAPEYFRGAMMRFILGDIRNSCFKEIKDRAEEQGVLDKLTINESQMTISYGKNSISAHGFRKSSGDQSAKLKSLANYNHVWVEEADEIPEADFIQLDDTLRTVKGNISVHLTLNPPPKSHWIINRWFNLTDSEQKGFYIPDCTHTDVLYIRSDYKDNGRNLDDNTKKRYEEYRTLKPDHYWNMIKGYVPEVVIGRIYTGWKEIDAVPHEATLLGQGLDFGFDPDPSAGLDIYYYNGGYILDEIVYETELTNPQLAKIFIGRKSKLIIADSAEPKSIQELRDEGLNVQPCVKGADSVRHGIKHVQSLKISYTKRSTNIKKEVENYAWKLNKEGENVGMEDPKCSNHLMSAGRYALSYLVQPQEIKKEYKEQIPDGKYDGQIPVTETARQAKPTMQPDGSMIFV
jgi:phage terminase large subunit